MECGNLIDILNTEKTALASFSAPEILKIAQRMRLTNSVYSILRGHYGISVSQLACFKPVLEQNRDSAIRKLFLSIKINELFQQYNIPVIHLKGLPLSQKLFGDPLIRQSCDIDLFISPQHLEQADEIFLENGIIRDKYSFLHDVNKLKKHRVLKDVSYVAEKYGIRIELHWRLFRWKNKFNQPFEFYWNNKVPIFMGGKNLFYTLSPIDEYLYVAVHGANHGFESLHWLYDFARYSTLLSMDERRRVGELVDSLSIQTEYQMATYCAERIFPNVFIESSIAGLLPNSLTRKAMISLIYHSKSSYRSKRRMLRMVANKFYYI
ncbi:TPA: nucleotidyltransferase family protein [Legionella pneumophila]|uniref:nucleotidyltransferase domain-containing protein n=1 Tax=Legionella pneumophila TaxID=446 RepID=UPI0004844F2A|nr:nucleotidyltransferase family protein [Legionella pneumophila]MCZ4701839.1 nucleotidyltransferase family protein [Legionella pneumophila]MCZ4732783.1 nucleotidyltransferase family protein [Legionella pneumophila]MCZ4753651.1 nucleotidyltransferase family protein [Legionella pneumophila]MDW9052493.1 nucleotidyltransferase family protein [Legionella pneumophila]MDW9061838.1 nucleotidyltransferase family protein [Legionella pneumophila]